MEKERKKGRERYNYIDGVREKELEITRDGKKHWE